MVTNTHITTPYSFSPFASIADIIKEACEKNIPVLGINDKNSIDGFGEFTVNCETAGIYPIYNIELSVHDHIRQQHDIHCKTANVFAMYPLLGLALRTPSPFSSDTRNLLASIWKQSQDRIWKMIDKTNKHLSACSLPIRLDYNRIRVRIARNSLHELHLSKALQHAVAVEADRQGTTHRQLFIKLGIPVPETDSPLHWRHAIHEALFTTGKIAYIPETASASLSLQQGKEILLHAGAIPCYPCDFQNNSAMASPETLHRYLIEQKIHAIEFIPQFADVEQLATYMHHFHREDFCVTIGTGSYSHTEPMLLPQSIDGSPLPQQLLEIGNRGACILAAHQEARKKNSHGFIDSNSNRLISGSELKTFITFGAEAINRYSNRKSGQPVG